MTHVVLEFPGCAVHILPGLDVHNRATIAWRLFGELSAAEGDSVAPDDCQPHASIDYKLTPAQSA